MRKPLKWQGCLRLAIWGQRGKDTEMYIRTALLTLAFGLCFATASQARDSTRNFTCEGVKDLVYDLGAVVLDTKNRHVYRRFVANRSYCTLEQVTKGYWVPTITGRCKLKICVEYDPYAD